MDVQDGPDGVVYLPALYWDSCKHDDEAIRLGRATDWVENEQGLVRGIGQKIFLVGEQDLPIMQFTDLVIADQAND